MATKLKTAKGGVWQKLLDALSKKMGKLVTNEELMKVSGQHNYARRVRELRAEGWNIVYQSKPGGYVLKSPDKKSQEADEYINLKLRQKVLERDGFICQQCGHKGGEKYADGETVRLEVDHIIPLKQGGKTTEENLWTMCSRCNAGKKSLYDYPETVKNKIISLNLPDEIKNKLSDLSIKNGRTVNDIIIETIGKGIDKL